MFLFSVLMFFVFACVGAWLLLFPAGRDLMTHSASAIGRRLEQRLRRDYQQGTQQASALGRGARCDACSPGHGLG